MAVDDYNDSRATEALNIVLRVEDNLGSVAEAVKLFNKTVDQDHALAVVSIFTPHSTALRPLSVERNVILFATVTSVVDFGTGFPYAFRDYISLPAQSQTMARYLYNTIHVRTAGSLVVNDDYGRDAMRLCREEFIRLGGQWIVEELFEQKDLNLRDAVTKVIASKPEALFLCGRELSLANGIRQLRELKYAGVIVSNNGFDTPTVFEAVGSAGQGVVFTSAAFDLQEPESEIQREFIASYRAKYDKDPDYNAAHGYTVGQALASAIQGGRRDPNRLREFLQGYSTTDILGKARMTENRDVAREVALYQLDNGVRRRIEETVSP